MIGGCIKWDKVVEHQPIVDVLLPSTIPQVGLQNGNGVQRKAPPPPSAAGAAEAGVFLAAPWPLDSPPAIGAGGYRGRD